MTKKCTLVHTVQIDPRVLCQIDGVSLELALQGCQTAGQAKSTPCLSRRPTSCQSDETCSPQAELMLEVTQHVADGDGHWGCVSTNVSMVRKHGCQLSYLLY